MVKLFSSSPLSRKSDQSAMTSTLRNCWPPVYRGNPSKCLFPKQVNLQVCSPHCSRNAASSREAINTNLIVIGLTGPGMKPKSTAPEAHALITRPFEVISKPVLYAVNAKLVRHVMVSTVLF